MMGVRSKIAQFMLAMLIGSLVALALLHAF